MRDSDTSDTRPPSAWQVEITVQRRDTAIFESVLAAADSVLSTAAGDEAWRLRAIFTIPPPRALIEASIALAASAAMVAPPRLSIEPLADKDWVAEGLKYLDAVKVGRFLFVAAIFRLAPSPVVSICWSCRPGFRHRPSRHQRRLRRGTRSSFTAAAL